MTTRTETPPTPDWTMEYSLLAIGMIVASGLHRGAPGYFEVINHMKYGRPIPPECEDVRAQCRHVLETALARLVAP
jgi:hypothetical protein